jgi:hypothetical protein
MKRSGSDHFWNRLKEGEKAKANLEWSIKIVLVLQSEFYFEVLNIPKGSVRIIRRFHSVACCVVSPKEGAYRLIQEINSK